MPQFVKFRDAYLVQPRSALLAFDFDGTLAPIVATPHEAKLDENVYQPLHALGELTDIAIISGRPTDYLRQQFAGLQVEIIGNYGRPERLSPESQALLHELIDRARNELPSSIFVEFKPSSLALHFRNAPDLEPEVIHWAQIQERKHSLSLDFGKSVVELAIINSSNKGKVLHSLAKGRTAVLYAGDDLGDISALKVLQQLQVATCGLAVISEQTPLELSTIADESVTRDQLVNYLISLIPGEDDWETR
ncbi:MAG: trehalose-phosphatase [Ferrimicrobium acidiphilum]